MRRLAVLGLLVAVYVAAVAVVVTVVDRAAVAATAVPAADGFSFPVGDPLTGAGHRVIRAFCSSGGSRGYHLGDDIAAADVPVRAAATGRVVVARFAGDWDGVVLVEHRLPGGSTVFTQYGHLQSVEVRPGQVVVREQELGVSGPPDARTSIVKHLHFEVKRLPTIGAGWSSHDPCPPGGYLAPSAFVRASPPPG